MLQAQGESGFDFLTARFGPQGVERARLVHTLVGVSLLLHYPE